MSVMCYEARVMAESRKQPTVNIRPDVGVLSVLRHLNYKAWFALAEFVDNSLESFLAHRTEIESAHGKGTKLKVEIEISLTDGGSIAIRDNAAGIYEQDYGRAFRPAEPPPAGTLSEFGMGMKSAACWFGSRFTVRSSALGEEIERTVAFDIDRIVSTKADTLPVTVAPAIATDHYTEVVVSALHNAPQTRTITKIKDHLASIYREFIRDSSLELRFRSPGLDEILAYEEPDVLFAPPAESLLRRRELSAEPISWRKNIQFDFGGGLRATGFAALRRRGSTSQAGFALFRNKRLIEGSGEDSYRPPQIFGASTTAVFQRLFGEFHLEGFSVSHTKDGFQWDENEEPFLEILREELDTDPIPLIDQARNASYDALRENPDRVNAVARDAVQDTSEALRAQALPVLEEQVASTPDLGRPPEELPLAVQSWNESFEVDLHGSHWNIEVEISNDPAIGEWVSVFDTGGSGANENTQGNRHLGVRLSLAHPFMTRFVGGDLDRIRPFIRIATAIGLAEITARESGVRQAGEIRRNINQLLREVLSSS